ncbi:adenylate/guanylate cyclase domain-containing protein [Thiomicrorhabdus sp.]|uniref:CHASE2 domain-containing protein n=1 Tax=Thiomicrorhabdus sp. TaxID=2039724 RepID=UPI002AA65760|nr:adenylate/guanylate cyclase domain-containing protein [Thiomicrorhabdus sp.]
MNKKHLSALLLSVVGAFFMAIVSVFSPPQLQTLDNSLRDIFFQIRGPIATTNNVVIVDIDEKSLKAFGQWPWERNLVAKLLNQLSQDGAGIIGLDMVFSEQDKTSPSYLNHKYQLGLNNPQNNDQVLAKALEETPTILGYVFLMNEPTPQISMPPLPAIIIEKNSASHSFLPKPEGVLPNISILQNSAYSSGFFNNLPDPSGMVRSVPLVMKYQNQIYPSIALEMLRIANQSQTIEVKTSETGVDFVKIGQTKIPTNRHGQLFLNFRGPGHTFTYISAADIINGNYNKSLVNGKWIIIGTSASGILDLRATPFDNAYPGVEAHATVIDNILKGDIISKPNWIDGLDLIIAVAIFLVSFLLFTYLSAFYLIVFFITGFIALYFYLSTMLFTEGLILNILNPFLALIFALVLSTLFNYFFETRQKNLIKTKLASKVSSSVMSEILKNESTKIMQGQTREITIFFSDIRGFTHLSEIMPNPQALIQFLNTYTSGMSDIIIKNQGTIDKYIGDAIMAYWNAPNQLKNHADIALKASLQQLNALQALNQKIKQDPLFKPITDYCKKQHIEPITIGIGLNTGEAVVGEMGTTGRSDYTAIGDTVNIGSRLESLCKYYGSELTISGQTKQALTEEYTFRFLDKVTLKGKEQPIEIWQVHNQGKADTNLHQELKKYHQAIELYQRALFKEAYQAFMDLQNDSTSSNHKTYAIYIKRCKHYIEHPPKDFNGVFIHNTKS